MKRGTWDNHCSGCAFYFAHTSAGKGRCAKWYGITVLWSEVCDRWKERG